MVMKKTINLKDAPFVVGVSVADKDMFPPGFRYRLGSIEYTVRRDVTQELNSPMREVTLSDGATEIMSVEVLAGDVRAIQKSNGSAGEILEPDMRFVPKTYADLTKKKVIKKAAKKKVAKKKTKKRSK